MYDIQRLIDRFKNQIDSYDQASYNEAHTRNDFINPFFETLGWDVNNQAGLAERYRHVIHEDALKMGRATKKPDYSFRVGGVRKFFVEAKKPAVSLKNDRESAFQVRRYGWSAKLPLSIITNFKEFAVYDCRIKPSKTDSASTARLWYLTYNDYLPQWETLVERFSFEAVWQGKLDQYVITQKSPKGMLEVDVAFLAEIERWREVLAQHIATKNAYLSQRQLNFVVQQTIDRIIFLRICEDRGIEDYGRLLAIINGSQVYPRLFQLFHEADQRYNSGLFHFKVETGRETPDELTPKLVIADDILQNIIKNLYYPDSPYEFSVLPTDILGQIYEQFLGKVIRVTSDRTVEVEEKPEVKKAGGVYYTPTYIVDYIVKQTLTPLLAGKKVGPRSTVNPLRIVDPACGSGSFLLGAYQFLLNWHLEQYLQEPEQWAKGKNPCLYQAMGRTWRLTIAERKRILRNHIFGVDIDPQAVEVTKLSLLVKVLEDEQSVISQLSFTSFRERVLPDLDHNIKCGNSLIGSDFYQKQQLSLLDEETRYRINAFDWEREFTGKFDAVIGNPPYGALLLPDATGYLLSHFKLQNYQLDTYLLFLEKALFLTKPNGIIGVIIPNTWLLNLTSNRIRHYLFHQTRIANIVHYQYHMFRQATVDTEVVIIHQMQPQMSHQVEIIIQTKEGTSKNYFINQARLQTDDGKPVNIFEQPEFAGLADKLRKCTVLDNLCVITQGAKPFQVGKGKPPQSQAIVDQKFFVSETPLDPTFRPLLRGSLIQRYQILWKNNYWISFGDWLAEPRYSANYEAPAKIVIRQTSDHLVATLDRNQFIVRDNLYTVVSSQNDLDLRFVLGIINSKLLQWFYAKVLNPEVGEALAQVKRGHLAQLPIATLNLTKSEHDQIVQLVEQMLELNQQLALAKDPPTKKFLARQIEATDRQIDQLVYTLYDLTTEEVEIIEKDI